MALARKLSTAEDYQNSATEPAFLAVTASAKGLHWRERLTAKTRPVATAISQQHGLPELLGRVLAGRGATLDQVPTLLNPTIKALMPDPSVIQDMDRAAARLADAISAKQSVAVFGDYDVDGGCSSALMRRFLRHHGLDCRIYIPDRIFEGYGPNPDAIESLVKDGAQLIVTVDCGTTSFEPLAHAARLGAEVIVIDHHQADERLPQASAVVNPNRQDDLSGLGQLCAAGVTFMVLVATSRELRRRGHYGSRLNPPDLLELLDLVALATVCDVVPLTGLNRAYVTRGLEVMRQRRNIGIRSLLDVAGLNQPPNPYHLGFVIGPRINAGGRIGDAALGSRLLATTEEPEATRIAELLDRLNKERKAIEQEILEGAIAEAELKIAENPDLPIVMLGSEDWHKGVVGLVASRLTERFRRPSCVIAWEKGGNGTGSLRSVAGVDVGTAVRAAVAAGLLVKGGGHAMAAGLTVSRDKLADVEASLCERLSSTAAAARSTATLDIDGALTPAAVNDEFIELLEHAGPYGQGNPAPRFAFPAARVKFAKVVGNAHVRCMLEAGDGSRIEAIAFRAAGEPVGELLMGTKGTPVHVAGSVKKDTWGGRQRFELQIEDAADPRTCT
ncbi:MAG: putative single-strand DNA-specific exonuclease RecJ [Pseudomonadota bacterium]|jgi:single-stranded-DNA-specific exonuclease